MSAVLTEFIGILTSGITSLANGVATGIAAMAKALFLVENTGTGGAVTYSLSVFGGIVGIFAGLSLAISITTRVYIWVTSLGN